MPESPRFERFGTAHCDGERPQVIKRRAALESDGILGIVRDATKAGALVGLQTSAFIRNTKVVSSSSPLPSALLIALIPLSAAVARTQS